MDWPDGYNLPSALVAGSRFDHANLDGIDLGNAKGIERASFRDALLSEQSHIRGRTVIGVSRLLG